MKQDLVVIVELIPQRNISVIDLKLTVFILEFCTQIGIVIFGKNTSQSEFYCKIVRANQAAELSFVGFITSGP